MTKPYFIEKHGDDFYIFVGSALGTDVNYYGVVADAKGNISSVIVPGTKEHNCGDLTPPEANDPKALDEYQNTVEIYNESKNIKLYGHDASLQPVAFFYDGDRSEGTLTVGELIKTLSAETAQRARDEEPLHSLARTLTRKGADHPLVRWVMLTQAPEALSDALMDFTIRMRNSGLKDVKDVFPAAGPGSEADGPKL